MDGGARGQDAIAPLAFLGGRTSCISLGTAIMQISSRAPVMTAMTVLTMAGMKNDRFLLGLVASGPQVVEGLHGMLFAEPLTLMDETIAIIRLACVREEIHYDGQCHKRR